MKNRLVSIIILLGMAASLLSLGGCKNDPGSTDAPMSASESEPASFASEAVFPGPDEESEPSPIAVELHNTYTTKFGETNAITYPPFSFDYPNGWTVTKENITQQSEMVTLTNDRGATITFSYIGGKNPGGGSAVLMQKVEVTKVADAAFVPGYVQAADYSDLGPFMVAELKLIGTLDMQTDKDYTAVDGGISYAVLPETFVGTHVGLRSAYILDFSFWYSGNIALIADAPDGGFTEQEKQEAIAILASFRDEDTSHKTTGGHTAASIDELWTMLEGTWVFEEYMYDGNSRNYSEHDLEFRHVDNKPCMSRGYQKDNGYFYEDVFFYDLASIDESTYDIYTYKRGAYGGEGANWSSDVRLVWWSFDLSNLADGEILLTYNIGMDNGSIDNSNTFKYSRR